MRARLLDGHARAGACDEGAVGQRERAGEGLVALSPAVSVIVVCFNAADTLPRCLDQLLAQDYPRFEVIVVDDGSDDDTSALARRHLAQGPHEHDVLRSARNRGCPHARNLGLARASGEIVAFIDADGYAARDWLRELVRPFTDARVGAVASTVFYDADPLVVNGAGGIVNRQGWAADLSMNEPYERARIAVEALYPMGCGMALRRETVDIVGPFDDRMLNYYDDVDYGIRVWRAGYRVVVAPGAWIDHDVSLGWGVQSRKALLCERHRMRVVLKHCPRRTLISWSAQEARSLRSAAGAVRRRKLAAAGWNVLHLPSLLDGRVRLRAAPRPPARLVDPCWGDAFPAGVAPLQVPRPELAGRRIEMADPNSAGQLPYGWFPVERVDGCSHRWAGVQAAAIVRLTAPARRLRLDYTHAPVDIGGVDVRIRRLDAHDPLAVVWSTRLLWQYIAHAVENHPIALPAGDYEVVFSVREGWLEPPLNVRTISLALASMSFEDAFQVPSGGLDMGSPEVEEQLVRGWFEAEESDGRTYRWASGHAEAVVRLERPAAGARLVYRLPPGPVRGLKLTVADLVEGSEVFTTSVPASDGGWREHDAAFELDAGEYRVSFDAETTWCNRDGRDPSLWAENRSLAMAVSSLTFLAPIQPRSHPADAPVG
jgi:GT2 family glycosyltransferase